MDTEPSREITTVREIRYQSPAPDFGLAVVLEILPGILIQTFGIGNLYAGNVGVGLLLMLGYWVTVGISFILCFVFIGFTWSLIWIAFMIIAPILANVAAKRRSYHP